MQDATRIAADISPQMDVDAGDFRTRSAARRRERMRVRLLEATMRVCAERDARAVVIDDVLRAADVSRATFYAHFGSLSEAINIVGQTLIDEATSVYIKMYAGVTDVHLRAAVGPQLFWIRSIIQPAWGSTIVQSYDFLAKSEFVRTIRNDISAGMRSGAFRRGDLQAAVDLNLGALVQGVKTLRDRQRGRMTYIRSLTESLLLGLGVPEAKSQAAVAWTREDLRVRGPQYLDWWKDMA